MKEKEREKIDWAGLVKKGHSSVSTETKEPIEQESNEELKQALEVAIAAIIDKKGQDILLLDVRGISSITDYLLIASGSVARQVLAIATATQRKLKGLVGLPSHFEGMDEGDWVVLDYMDFVIHIFDPAHRDFYRLEEVFPEARKEVILTGE